MEQHVISGPMVGLLLANHLRARG